MPSSIGSFDLVFVVTAIAFNLLIAGIFVAQKNGWARAVRAIGIAWLLLSIPLAVVFFRYWAEGRRLAIIVYFGLVLLYMLVEFLLDYVFRLDFRRKWVTHAPYIVLEYAALFSLIGIASDIDRIWGYVVGVFFWILMGSLIYLYWDKIRPPKNGQR